MSLYKYKGLLEITVTTGICKIIGFWPWILFNPTTFIQNCIYEFSYNLDTVLYQFLETGTSDRCLLGNVQLMRFSWVSSYNPFHFPLSVPLSKLFIIIPLQPQDRQISIFLFPENYYRIRFLQDSTSITIAKLDSYKLEFRLLSLNLNTLNLKSLIHNPKINGFAFPNLWEHFPFLFSTPPPPSPPLKCCICVVVNPEKQGCQYYPSHQCIVWGGGEKTTFKSSTLCT